MSIFTYETPSEKPSKLIPGEKIAEFQAILSTDVHEEAKALGDGFAVEIETRFFADFEKAGDQMVHVSTFCVIGDMVYMTYYANVEAAAEDPNHQRARFAFCPLADPSNMTVYDIQAVGDTCSGLPVNLVYDTIFAQKDDDTLILLWTAKVGDRYYRLYRTYTISTDTLGEIGVNRFRVGETEYDFSTSGIQNALTENGFGYKTMYSDIGIMQKFTSRTEHGETWYYTGTYSGDFNAIIKSRDFITWEFVAQPDFPNESKWENAVYVIGDRCFYFVRQHDHTGYGFLTVYDLVKKTWETPVLIGDSQSRGDFICYEGRLYLFHAPIDREHIGIVRIDTEHIANSRVVLQAHMHTSCFYPFVQTFHNSLYAMSYTVNRQHIRLGAFDPKIYFEE
ncbi:MAG: hypothetical protein MJ175_08455 [Clostridia bacterium]|nr:hypothetical protein [Clostridia bacterium]